MADKRCRLCKMLARRGYLYCNAHIKYLRDRMLQEGYLQQIKPDKPTGHDSHSMNKRSGKRGDNLLHLDQEFLAVRKPVDLPWELK